MIIKDIPGSVFKRALELRGLDTDKALPQHWTWENEYSYQEDRAAFSNGELEKAISEYLLTSGEWSSR